MGIIEITLWGLVFLFPTIIYLLLGLCLLVTIDTLNYSTWYQKALTIMFWPGVLIISLLVAVFKKLSKWKGY